VASDGQASKDVGPQTTYLPEYAEDENPKPGLPHPELSTEEFIRLTQWQIDRALYFIFFMSLGCVSAVILASNPIVEALVGTIWVGSMGLARRLLGGAYHQKDEDRRT
jgi:hypothetical protein